MTKLIKIIRVESDNVVVKGINNFQYFKFFFKEKGEPDSLIGYYILDSKNNKDLILRNIYALNKETYVDYNIVTSFLKNF